MFDHPCNRKLCLAFKWNFLYFQLCPLSLFLLMGSADKSLAVSSLLHSIRAVCVNKILLKHLFSRLNTPSSFSCFSCEKGFSPLSLLVLKSPELNTARGMCLTSRGSFTVLALLATFFKMQPSKLSAFFAARVHHGLLASFLFTRSPRSSLTSYFPAGFIWIPGIIILQVLDFAFPLVEHHQLNSSKYQQVLCCISHFSPFFILCEFAGCSLCPTVHVINEGVKQYWPQYQSLGYTTSCLAPTRLHATYHNLLDTAAKPVFSLHHSPPI